MDYSFLDRDEYKEIPIYRITENKNGLPFFIIKLNTCNQTIHRHEFVQINYMVRGRLKHVINNNTFEIYRGDIFIIPPYVPHYYIEEQGEKYELIEFEFIPEFLNERFSPDLNDTGFMDFAYLEPFFVSENEVKPRLNLKGSIQTEVENILGEVLREYQTRESDVVLLVKAMLLKLLVLVGREFKRSISDTDSQSLFDRQRDALYNALSYINLNYMTDISIEETTRVAMLSQSYFRCLFKQLTQKTFIEYVNDLRINKAIELLRARRDMKILDICYEVGFHNINHFNKIFRQITGTTPMSYRKSKV